MNDRTTALRVVYGVIWFATMYVIFGIGGGLGLMLGIAGFALAALLWPSVKPGASTTTTYSERGH